MSSDPLSLHKPQHSPEFSPEWESFYKFVATNLGDIPVLDAGKFISRKIEGYWKIWCFVYYLRSCGGELLPGHLWFLLDFHSIDLYLDYPPTRGDHAKLLRFMNLWKLLGGQIQ